ncbi:LOW QUALITY PROTEIN: hypothetical protein Cgig2_006652 [Carnegiea gigantea]|uniref:Uncharacterized protein n=1 Tax=Carnegiea gigantea TaxID=171969 RepID=A0A9Q1GWY1_9CARY|nr:LOW QUALITY PROTEIN: hypothetical protein Cgig2_006652 [Carnegiea gigantea]
MWTKDESFKGIIKESMEQHLPDSRLWALQKVLCKLRQPLKNLNRNRYADIYTQQPKAIEELTKIKTQLQQDPGNKALLQREATSRNHYVKVNQSAISLIKQQGKADWIAYRDECSRLFMSRIKQRKAMSSIYTLRDHTDQWVEGFEEVAEVMTKCYQELLGKKEQHRSMVDHQSRAMLEY